MSRSKQIGCRQAGLPCKSWATSHAVQCTSCVAAAHMTCTRVCHCLTHEPLCQQLLFVDQGDWCTPPNFKSQLLLSKLCKRHILLITTLPADLLTLLICCCIAARSSMSQMLHMSLSPFLAQHGGAEPNSLGRHGPGVITKLTPLQQTALQPSECRLVADQRYMHAHMR